MGRQAVAGAPALLASPPAVPAATIPLAIGFAKAAYRSARERGFMPTNLPQRGASSRTAGLRSDIESLMSTCLLTLILFTMFACLSASFGSDGISNIQTLAADELCLDRASDLP
jgi:hypothetical protein